MKPSMSFCRTSGVNSGEPSTFHHAVMGPGELLEEMLDPAWPAPKVVEHNLTHDAPAQTWPPRQCLIDVGDADDIFGDKIIDLSRQRGLQAIGDVAGHFLTEPNGLLSETGIEFDSALNRRFRRLCYRQRSQRAGPDAAD